ncbi:hypothetical protein [Enterococcus casseliflavus]|uniref:hypothetical protein n=1 Tax=Enterococcus casseliflavus TaxID=37734 RepID=UPI001C8B4B33|nr:hypothetical protein [Enterococcus casseliflavus]MBX9115915.1 hypothetical protein [Enterococcus casseliflavus]MBX9126356.1 hypothetical protein [Enterococcus casseliflavus]
MGAGTLLEGKNGAYRILMSINAQADVEELTGVNMFELSSRKQDLRLLRKIFTIALQYGEKDKEIDFSKAGDIMDDVLVEHDIHYLTEKLTEELNRALGIKEEPQETEESQGEDEGSGKLKSFPMKK